jgi:hypothetical protein
MRIVKDNPFTGWIPLTPIAREMKKIMKRGPVLSILPIETNTSAATRNNAANASKSL